LGLYIGEKNPNFGVKSRPWLEGDNSPLRQWHKENPDFGARQRGDANPVHKAKHLYENPEYVEKITRGIREHAEQKRGSSYEEVYGEDKAAEYKQKLRDASPERLAKSGRKETKPERIIREILEKLEIPFQQEAPIGPYTVDFFLQQYNIVIQADGDYWHANPSIYKELSRIQKTRRRIDASCDSFLGARGYRVLRFWESDLISNPEKCQKLCRSVSMSGKNKQSLGIGLDPGTMNVVSARKSGDQVTTARMRDAFIDLEAGAKKMLKLSGVDFIDHGDDGIVVIGDAALEMATVFGRELRRPLSRGLIAAGEIDALGVLGVIVKGVLGPPKEPNEICYFCVPAAPVDETRDVVYHRGVLERIVTECGYDAVASNEAMAIVYAETAKENFSGIGISFGSGMTNVALSINGVEGMAFSCARGGDWIDAGAAKAVGSTSSRICAIKEKGIDLISPKSREEEALVLYYKSLIEYVIDQIAKEFERNRDKFALPREIPIVVGGGTSLAGGFLPLFQKVFDRKKKRFPIQVSEIRAASDPLNAVANGLLLQAMQEYAD
jgi:very-short-patch-repair endonuclease